MMPTVENDPISQFIDEYEFLADCGNAVPLTTEQKRIILDDALNSWAAQEAEREKCAIAEAVAAERERILERLTPDIVGEIESAFESYEASRDTSQEENDVMATKYIVLEAINSIQRAAK